ncbi:hypothetical protein N7467_007697 [Penicillium canescens]|nr:hypothetical protein N7467_007697 [Penicillium canescens]
MTGATTERRDRGFNNFHVKNNQLRSILKALDDDATRRPEITLADCERRGDHLFYKNRLYIPDHDEFKAEILRQCHDKPAAGPPGRSRHTSCCPKNSTGRGYTNMSTNGRRNATPAAASHRPEKLAKVYYDNSRSPKDRGKTSVWTLSRTRNQATATTRSLS